MNSKRSEQIVNEIVVHLKQLRCEKGVSHETLAHKIGISRPAISHIESGKRKPSLLITLKISQGLGVKLSSIIKMFEK